jgi:integrase
MIHLAPYSGNADADARRGGNPKVVSEILGHSDVTITLGVYGHVTPRMHQMAVDAIDSVFG